MTAKQVRLLICKLSAMLAGMLEREKIIRAEDRAVYEYGFQITIANITNALIVLLIGLITHSIVRVLIFYTVFLSMRMFCGGFHAKTYTRCFCLFGTTCLLCMVAGYGVMEFTNVLSAAVISAGRTRTAPGRNSGNRPRLAFPSLCLPINNCILPYSWIHCRYTA